MIRFLATRHSIFAQIVLWAVFTAAEITFGLWLLTDATIQGTSRVALERALQLDLAGIADIYAGGGVKELSKRIHDRLAYQPREGSRVHYLLIDQSGRRLAGDIERWPALEIGTTQSTEIFVHGKPALARSTRLGPGLQLLIALEHREIQALLRQLAFVFLMGGVLAMLAVALGGWMAARRLAGRIEKINAAFRQPDETALEELTLGTNNPDEIDELASHSANALARLRQLVSSQREVTDHVAHEIRTPLMHLDNRLAKTLAAPDVEISARIADARTEIHGIIRMLESLLDIAATEARRGDHQGLEPVDLSAIATHLGELYADAAEDSGHHLTLDIEPGVVIRGEEMPLTRLVTNLLDNAFKFVPRGGTVLLRLRPGPELTVSDNGPGIAADQRERIFEKFGRGGSSLGKDGAGLGLALCRAIAERHHLKITLASDERGSCFTVSPETQR